MDRCLAASATMTHFRSSEAVALAAWHNNHYARQWINRHLSVAWLLVCSLAMVPPSWDDADYLLGGTGAKKGLMKSGAAWRVGPMLNLEGIHLDGGPIKFSLQVTYGGLQS